MKEINLIRAGSCELFAFALFSLFPSVCLIGGAPTSWGFYYDFSLKGPLPPDFLSTIEDKMRFLARQNISFEVLEMMPSNALDYFLSIGQKYRRDVLEEWEEPLVSVVRMGDFADVFSFELPSDMHSLRHFHLLECLKTSRGFRVIGVATSQKDELKEKVRNWRPLLEREHTYWVQQRAFLWQGEGGWIWLPKGEEVRQQLFQFWKETSKDFSFISTPGLTLEDKKADHREMAKFFSLSKTAEMAYLPLEGRSLEGLFDTAEGFVDRAYFHYKLENLEEVLISSLQSIVKILKMLSFDFEVVLRFKNGKILKNAFDKSGLKVSSVREERGFSDQIEFRIADVLGRWWQGPLIQVDSKEQIVMCSLFYSLERFIALLLEKGEGSLPLFLEPEQARILGTDEDVVADLAQFLSEKGVRFTADLRKEKLSLKMHDALRERVPFSIVVGKEIMNQLSVRALAQKEPVLMTKETLIDRLKNIENQ